MEPSADDMDQHSYFQRWVLIRKLLLLPVLTLSIAPEANAELITLDIVGEIFSITGTPFGLALTIGEPVTGTLTYDTSIADINSSPTVGGYPHSSPDTYFATVHGLTFQPGTGNAFVQITNGTSVDVLSVTQGKDYGSGSVLVGGVLDVFASFDYVFRSSDLSTFTSDDLPTLFPPLSLFDQERRGRIADRNNDRATFRITSVTQRQTALVPEPATFALLTLGLLPLLVYCWRRRQS